MSSAEERAAERRATWTGFLARSFEEAAAYKRAEDEAIPPHMRAEMIWELVTRMPGRGDASEFRLDRTVGRVERRGR
jgi:hypothetical protein